MSDVAVWMSWAEVPWKQRAAPHSDLIQLCETLAGSPLTNDAGLNQALAALSAGFGAPACTIWSRQEAWQQLAGIGGPLAHAAAPQLNDVIDRDAAVLLPPHEGNPPRLLAPTHGPAQEVLILSGQRLTANDLPSVLAVAQVLGRQLHARSEILTHRREAARLRLTLEIARKFATEREVQPLLERMAEEAAELLGSERASIFIWDPDRSQLVACPALGVEGGRLWIPDNKGIVGEVVQTGRTIRVDDAYADSRFDQSVDKSSGFRTRNLLCVPLENGAGERIGAFELINKNTGTFTSEDERALHDFAAQVAVAIATTREREQLLRNNRQLTERVRDAVTIVGESPAIDALRGTIERLAATDLPVLILGESGTGKEVAAQALHYQSPRAEQPFVAVNCAALTETLLESELFGHEQGAFTDAHSTHIGKFELADGGTLFLDEIGDMSPGGQAKLLRVLEQKVITRVGGTQPIPVNVRVLAATNAELAERVREKQFRQDLYYRLSVVTVELPPLRERPEDILPMAEFFLEQFCVQASRKRLEISPEARRRLQVHGWPGNVRELRNLMERVAFLTNGPRVETEDLAFILSPQRDVFDDLSAGVGLAEATNRFQREYIRRAVKRVQGNMSEAAGLLELHRSNLYRKMRQLGMEVDDVKH